jgi:hypothetical protein
MILGNPHPQLTVRNYETPQQAVNLLCGYLKNIATTEAE